MDGAIEREIYGHETGKPPQAELVRDSWLTALPEGASPAYCCLPVPLLLYWQWRAYYWPIQRLSQIRASDSKSVSFCMYAGLHPPSCVL